MAALLSALATPVFARATLGLYDGWGAFRDGGSNPVCFVMAAPLPDGKRLNRDPAYLTVSIWPARNISVQLYWAPGFTVGPATDVTLETGRRRFSLLAQGDGVWARDEGSDLAIMQALRHGAQVSLSATSTRGTQVTDRFSLKGFSAAFDTAQAACAR